MNYHTYRWLINGDGNFKLTASGWYPMTTDEEKFIKRILQYELYDMYEYEIDLPWEDEPAYRYKFGVTNPFNINDTLLIYIMNGTTWKI